MRIDSNQGAPPLPENQAANNVATDKASTGAAQSVSDALGEDQAQLSGVHLQAQSLVAHVLQLPEITHEKVKALQQAIVSGQYRPRPEQIAGALFSSLVEKVAA